MPTTVFVSSEGCQGRFDRNRPWRPGSSGSQVSETGILKTGIRQTRSQGFLLVENNCTLKRDQRFMIFSCQPDLFLFTNTLKSTAIL